MEKPEKKVIIKEMKTQSYRKPREKGHHRGDEDPIPFEIQKNSLHSKLNLFDQHEPNRLAIKQTLKIDTKLTDILQLIWRFLKLYKNRYT